MKAGDKKQFLALLEALAATFRVELDQALITGYWIGLRKLSIEDFEIAVDRAVSELSEYGRLPLPRSLLELVGAAEIPASQRAALAWTAVYDAIGTHGAYATVQFDNPATTATVRALGGWVELCGRPMSELQRFVGAEFRRVYEALSARPIDALHAKPMLGLHDQVNGQSGHVERLQGPVIVATGLPPAPTARPMLEQATSTDQPRHLALVRGAVKELPS